jgi:hypothetical protein
MRVLELRGLPWARGAMRAPLHEWHMLGHVDILVDADLTIETPLVSCVVLEARSAASVVLRVLEEAASCIYHLYKHWDALAIPVHTPA